MKKEKLLLLGLDNISKYAIEYCREIGVHTIVTDYRPLEESPAKQMADEYWMIDLEDMDALEKKSREEGVTGVFAGSTEYCLDRAQLLTKRLGLPFYATDESWACSRDKQRFKERCIELGIDVPKQYKLQKPFTAEMLAELEYPVVVKPIDSGASLGFRICRNEEEFLRYYDYAESFSARSRVIIEELLEGPEFETCFFIKDGKLISVWNDMILYEKRENGSMWCSTMNPNAMDEHLADQHRDKIERLSERLGIKSGFFYIQSIYSNGKYYCFEFAHRVDGLGVWTLTDKMKGFSHVRYLVDMALGHQAPALRQAMPEAKVGGIYFYWADPGKIAKIVGRDEAFSIPGVECTLERFQTGDVIKDTYSLLQMAYYVSIVAKDYDSYIDKLKLFTSTLKIYDENGAELTVPAIPEEGIRKYAVTDL